MLFKLSEIVEIIKQIKVNENFCFKRLPKFQSLKVLMVRKRKLRKILNQPQNRSHKIGRMRNA